MNRLEKPLNPKAVKNLGRFIAMTTTATIPSYRISSVQVVFNVNDDDKDKEEPIEITVYGGAIEVGKGTFGVNTRWADPGSYPCDISLNPNFPVIRPESLRIRMYKRPHGSDSGNGMICSIDVHIRFEDGRVALLRQVPKKQYGDGHAYDVWL